MQLTEITKREIARTSKQTQAWADKRENRPVHQLTRSNIDLNKILGPHLRKQGLKNVGKGQFAVVYGRSGSNRVVKVSKKEDYCWLKYAEWAMGQNNPHVPEIYHLESYQVSIEDQDTDLEMGTVKVVSVFFAVMEKLKPFKVKDINIKDNLPLLVYLSEYVDGIDISDEVFARALGAKPESDNWVSQYSDKFYEKLGKLERQGSRHPAVKLFTKVENMWERCAGDMHSGNLMIRPSTGEIVITDPIWEPSGGGGWGFFF
jgi:hypothetical protein